MGTVPMRQKNDAQEPSPCVSYIREICEVIDLNLPLMAEGFFLG